MEANKKARVVASLTKCAHLVTQARGEHATFSGAFSDLLSDEQFQSALTEFLIDAHERKARDATMRGSNSFDIASSIVRQTGSFSTINGGRMYHGKALEK